jgi:serine/threonine protein kinase
VMGDDFVLERDEKKELRRLGSGSFGTVYRAHSSRNGRAVALNIFSNMASSACEDAAAEIGYWVRLTGTVGIKSSILFPVMLGYATNDSQPCNRPWAAFETWGVDLSKLLRHRNFHSYKAFCSY